MWSACGIDAVIAPMLLLLLLLWRERTRRLLVARCCRDRCTDRGWYSKGAEPGCSCDGRATCPTARPPRRQRSVEALGDSSR